MQADLAGAAVSGRPGGIGPLRRRHPQHGRQRRRAAAAAFMRRGGLGARCTAATRRRQRHLCALVGMILVAYLEMVLCVGHVHLSQAGQTFALCQLEARCLA